MTANVITFNADVITGQIRTFGPSGPAYKIQAVEQDKPNHWVGKVLVLDSGEEFKRPIDVILQDPVED